MDKQQVLEIMVTIDKEITTIKDFLNDYFVMDLCNCDKCNRKRNKKKIENLYDNIHIIKVFELQKKHLNNPNNDLFSSISSIYEELKQTQIHNADVDISRTTPSYRGFCEVCGTFMEEDFNGQYICNTCRYKYFDKCGKCGKFMRKSPENNFCNGLFYCPDCVKELERCPNCNRLQLPENMQTMQNFINREGILLENGRLCNYCAETYVECTGCNRMVHSGNIHLVGNTGRFCPECVTDKVHLFDYSFKPILKYCFNKNKTRSWDKNGLYYGTELEVEVPPYHHTSRNSIIKKISDTFGGKFIYGKYDGSLDHGFEYVTHPFEWEWFLNNKNKFNELFAMSKLMGLTVRRTCGVHIHMSKKGFTSYHLYKFMNFINNEKHRTMVNFISGRDITSHTYCHVTKGRDNIIRGAKLKEKSGLDRYSAVNILPKNTAEIRIFAGTLEAAKFYSYMEFLHSVHGFTKNVNNKNCNTKRYMVYLNKNKNQNLNLIRRIKKETFTGGLLTCV